MPVALAPAGTGMFARPRVKSRLPARPRQRSIPLTLSTVSVSRFAKSPRRSTGPCGSSSMCSRIRGFDEHALEQAKGPLDVKTLVFTVGHAHARSRLSRAHPGMSGPVTSADAPACARPPCNPRGPGMSPSHGRRRSAGKYSPSTGKNPTALGPTTSAGWAPTSIPSISGRTCKWIRELCEGTMII